MVHAPTCMRHSVGRRLKRESVTGNSCAASASARSASRCEGFQARHTRHGVKHGGMACKMGTPRNAVGNNSTRTLA